MVGVGKSILAFSLRKPSDSTRQLNRFPRALASPAWADAVQACNNTRRARRSCSRMSSSSTMAPQHRPPSTQRSTASWTRQRRMQQPKQRRSKARAPRDAPTGPWT